MYNACLCGRNLYTARPDRSHRLSLDLDLLERVSHVSLISQHDLITQTLISRQLSLSTFPTPSSQADPLDGLIFVSLLLPDSRACSHSPPVFLNLCVSHTQFLQRRRRNGWMTCLHDSIVLGFPWAHSSRLSFEAGDRAARRRRRPFCLSYIDRNCYSDGGSWWLPGPQP